MTSIRAEPPMGGYLLRLLLILSIFVPYVAGANGPAALNLPPLTDEQEAWLVTIEPGEIYWQRFGHNAIWLREPARGLEHTFNFGYFDFEQENFLLRFVTGRMLYQSLAFQAEMEFGGYAGEGRAIRAQRLNLSPVEYARLRDHLLWHVQPANRDYLYDYYLDNCSTRIRDAIDLALNGGLSEATRDVPAEANFRDHTRRLTGMTFWYYLGLEAVLGMPVDRPISRWDEMFLPHVVAKTVDSTSLSAGRAVLAGEAHWIYGGDDGQESATASALWWRYLAASLALLVVLRLSLKRKPALLLALARGWLASAASLGVVLLLLWGFTDHRVVAPNFNLMLLNPVFAILLSRRLAGPLLLVVLFCGSLASAQWPVLNWQYGVDVLALVLPLNLAAAWALYRGVSGRPEPA